MSKPSTATLNSVLGLKSKKYRKSVDRTRCIISWGRARMQVNSSGCWKTPWLRGSAFLVQDAAGGWWDSKGMGGGWQDMRLKDCQKNPRRGGFSRPLRAQRTYDVIRDYHREITELRLLVFPLGRRQQRQMGHPKESYGMSRGNRLGMCVLCICVIYAPKF